MHKSSSTINTWLKVVGGIGIIVFHFFITIGLLNLYYEEGIALCSIIAFVIGFMPTIIAILRKSHELTRILMWNILFFPVADLIVLTDDTPKEQIKQKPEYICESCNETFGLPEKTNKFLKICGLLLIYGLILYLIESIPTNDLSNLLPRFILDMAFIIIAIVHILITLFKDSGRGKCPYCGATDFISINSVKGQNLIKQVKELRTKIKQQGEK